MSDSLRYSQLWDGLKIVADQAEESKEWMTRITRFFKEKAELDKHYSKTLKKMVEKLNMDTTENATFQQFLTSFRGLNSTLAVNFEILSAKIEEQVYKPLNLAKDHHSTSIKKIITESIRLTKLYNSAYENLEKSRVECAKACRELSETKKELQQQEEVNMIQDVFSAFKSDVSTLSKKALAADQKYMAAVKHMRGFRSQFDTSMAHLLDQFQVLEQERITQSVNHLRHYMSVQSGMLASNQKNVAAVVSVLERIDIDGDIQTFIQHHKTDKKPPPLPEYEMFPGHPNYRPDASIPDAISDEEIASPRDEYGSDDGDENDEPVVKKPVVKKVVVKSPTPTKTPPLTGTPEPKKTTTTKTATSSSTSTSTSTSAGKKPPPPKTAPPPNGAKKPPPPTKKSPAVSSTPAPSLAMATAAATVEAASAAASHAAVAIKSVLKKTITQADVANITVGARSAEDESKARRESKSEEKSAARLKAEETLTHLFSKITGHADVNDDTSDIKDMKDGQDLTNDEWEHAHELFTTTDGRHAFAYVLNKQRNHNTGLRLTPLSFSLLARLTLDFLDEAKTAMHVYPAQLTMIMSQTFYRDGDVDEDDDDEKEKKEDDRKDRIYLVTAIKDHPIWKDIRFWEEAFFDSFRDKVQKHTKVARWHSDAEQAESLHTQRQIVFSSLGTFAHNMMDFGIDPKMICAFVEKMANINELEAEQLTLLRQLPCYTISTPLTSPSNTTDLEDEDGDHESGFQSADSADDDTDTPISADADFPIPAIGRPKRIMTGDDEDGINVTPPEQEAPVESSVEQDDSEWDRGSGVNVTHEEASPAVR